MSIAISNGQTKAATMQTNEFTQVTHDENKNAEVKRMKLDQIDGWYRSARDRKGNAKGNKSRRENETVHA